MANEEKKGKLGNCAKFIIKKTPTGGFNFSLLAKNSEKICVASQVYSAKANCKKALASIAKASQIAISGNKIADSTLQKPTDFTCPKFEIYFDNAKLFRFRLFASNGENIAISEEGYKSKSGCLNGMKSIAVNSAEAVMIDETVDN